MPCSNLEYTGIRRDNFPWENFTRSVRYNVPSYFLPDSLGNLVWIISQAEASNIKVKAVGSGWSLSNIAVSSQWVVDISSLNNRLTYLIDEGTVSEAVTTARRNIHADPAGEKYIHVEAGMKVFDLNVMLQDMGLSMITLGGAQGQTLAGAISTSTHGSNPDLPPLPDLVMAIHLVTTGGKEMWIESESNPFTDNDALLTSILPCADTEIVRNDALFNAVRVGVGRFGVIYSYVLKATSLFHLAEWAQTFNWPDVASRLRSGIGMTGRAVFAELNTLMGDPPAALGINTTVDDYRYLDITFNPRRSSTCWVRRHWTTSDTTELNMDDSPSFLCHHTVGNLILGAASVALSQYAGVVSLIPFYGLIKGPEIAARATYLAHLSLDPHMTGGRALAESVNAVWDSQIGDELRWLIEELNQIALNGSFDKSLVDGKRGVSWNITSGKRESAFDRDCYNGQSVEMIFSLSNGTYIDYIDFLLREASDFAQVGYISVRFSRKSEALISMHNVDHDIAVSIEITSLDGLRGSSAWLNLIERRGIDMGGRPHWGQRNSLTSVEVSRLYSDQISTWREMLSEVVDLNPMFSNTFTSQRGLEPFRGPRVVTGVREVRGRITHLCGEGPWSPVPIEMAIDDIKNRRILYFHVLGTTGTIAVLILKQYLTTDRDDRTDNNLRSLPTVPRPAYGSPPADLIRRRVTSITVENRGGVPWTSHVTFMHNDEEMWSVSQEIAFNEVYRGSHEYFIQTTDGTVTLLEAREYLTTFVDGVEENNLDSLPEC